MIYFPKRPSCLMGPSRPKNQADSNLDQKIKPIPKFDFLVIGSGAQGWKLALLE